LIYNQKYDKIKYNYEYRGLVYDKGI